MRWRWERVANPINLIFTKYLLLIIFNSITISTYFLLHQVSFLHRLIPKYINSPILTIEIPISILHSFASFVASVCLCTYAHTLYNFNFSICSYSLIVFVLRPNVWRKTCLLVWSRSTLYTFKLKFWYFEKCHMNWGGDSSYKQKSVVLVSLMPWNLVYSLVGLGVGLWVW